MFPLHDAVYITAPSPKFLKDKVELSDIAAALSIGDTLLERKLPVEIINAGLNTLIVPIKTLEDEISMYPDEQRLREFCLKQGIDIVLVFSMETASSCQIAHTRVFAPKFGYLEDPATGSGNSAFANYMLKHGLWNGSDCSVEQGGQDRIFNSVKLGLADGRVVFGGSSTTRISGTYFI